MDLEDLINDGRVERVHVDPDRAALSLDEAERHLASAEAITEADPNGAYQLAYDGARKAIVSRMRREGHRVRRGEGAHAMTAQYAIATIDDELGQKFELMRRARNRSEYATAYFSSGEVADAIAVAVALIAAVRR